MFLKKGLLFTTALALLMFAGQAFAQLPSVSLSHVTDGTAGEAAGSGTAVMVKISQTGVGDIPAVASAVALDIELSFDSSLLSLAVPPPLQLSGSTVSIITIPGVPLVVPAEATLTFTTLSDVTGVEFSVGITGVTVHMGVGQSTAVPVSASLTFNEGGTGSPGNGNGGMMPGNGGMPSYDNLAVSLSRVGEGPVAAGDEVVINVGVDGLEGSVVGAEITFAVDPAGAAVLSGVSAATGLGVSPDGIDGMSFTLIGVPTMLTDGSYGTATFTMATDYDGSMASINVASLNVLTTAGMRASAAAGDAVMVSGAPIPELQTENTDITFEDFGVPASVSITAMNFPEGAEIDYSYEATADFQAMEDGANLMITTASAGTVTVTATDGTSSASLTLTFMDPDPYLTASEEDVIIPEGGMKSVTVMATGLEGAVTYAISSSGTATINADTDGAMVTITGSGMGSATVTVTASDASFTTEAVSILFRAMPTVGSDATEVTVPQTEVGSAMAMVIATGFPEGAAITFNVDPAEHVYLSTSADGNVLTLTATGTVSVSVTASGAGVTTSAVEISFEQTLPAAPASVVVQDQEGDNGYYVMVSFANSANHADVSQYRVYREMMVNTAMDADGNVVTTDTPVAKWVPWAVIDAMDNDDEEGMTRAVVPVTDGNATRWGVAAEKGMDSAEITPAGKRVFSKESVLAMAQFLGLDPNLMVNQDELAEMFMPSADYISSLINGRQNVVFAALDPDLGVLMGDVSIPQNIRTGGHLDPIVSSSITATEGMVAAIDDTAPAAVTDVAADAETGIVTWTMSADDMIVGMINYRGYAMPIPGVIGYKVMGGASEDAMIDIGAVPAGSSSFQVPLPLIESLINQGVPAVLVTVTAMDGTNMTPSVPLVVELIPTRKPFVDADGGPVYIVKLDRHGAMTPLTVDFEDFVAFTMAFNTDETHENWRVFVQADLNDDKMVNFSDFILFFGSYGKEAQGPAGKSLVTPSLGVNEAAELTLRLGSDRVVVGENMFVDVSLANVQALMGYGFVLNYDAEKFEFVEAMPAAEDFLASSGGETPLFKGWSPESGQVHVMNAIANGSEVSGNGDIVRLVFRVLRDFQDDARFEIAEGLVFDPSQFANPLVGGVLDIQTTPTEFALLQNFPNPFNPETTIGYELAESADVTLQIYNVVGQVVRTLIASESQSVGRYQVRWDGMDDRGMPVSSGIYFYQISAGKFQDVRKLMLLK